MSARERVFAALEGSPEVRPGTAEQLVADLVAEVLHETPLYLAEYDGAETEVHLNSDDARAMCDDVAGPDSMSRGWDWSRNEHGDYVQFWTHEDDDRPLHMTGGTVTEIRVQRPADVKQGKATPVGEPTSEALPFTEARAAFMQIGCTPALQGLRAVLLIEGQLPLVGRYCGSGMRRAEHHDGLLFVEPRLAFEYDEPADGEQGKGTPDGGELTPARLSAMKLAAFIGGAHNGRATTGGGR